MLDSFDTAGPKPSWNTVLGMFSATFFTPKMANPKLHIFFNIPVLIVFLNAWKISPCGGVAAKSLSTLWMKECLLRFSFRLKLLPHITHSNGFSPLWTGRYRVRAFLSANSFLHPMQRHNFSSMWTRRCWLRLFKETHSTDCAFKRSIAAANSDTRPLYKTNLKNVPLTLNIHVASFHE